MSQPSGDPRQVEPNPYEPPQTLGRPRPMMGWPLLEGVVRSVVLGAIGAASVLIGGAISVAMLLALSESHWIGTPAPLLAMMGGGTAALGAGWVMARAWPDATSP